MTTNPNPRNYVDGEVLPVRGGPLDGEQRKISVLFPFINGGCPSAGFICDGHPYMRDDEARSWIYVGKDVRR